MPRGRARKLQNIVIVLVLLLGLACLTLGLNVVAIGSNALLVNNTAHAVLKYAGIAMLASGLVSLIWPRWRGTQAKIFFSGAVFLVLLAVSEAAARMVYEPAPPHPNFTFWTADPEIGFVTQANCGFRFLAANGWISGTTDSSGNRPVIASKDLSDAPEVICLGDSTTFSCEMGDDQTWPEAAARTLAGRGKPCRMLNRAVYGFSGLQSMLMLKRCLQHPGKCRAVVYHFCINDPTENLSTYMPCPLLKPTGKQEPIESMFTIVPPEQPMLAQLSSYRLRPEFALVTAFRTWRFSTSESAYRNGAAAGFPFDAELCGRFVKEPRLQDSMRYVLAGMKKECDRAGVPLFVSAVNFPWWDKEGVTRDELTALLHPTDLEGDAKKYNGSCDLLRRLTEEAGGHYIDIRGCLDGMKYREYVASPLDWHFSAAANQRIGEAIARELENRLR